MPIKVNSPNVVYEEDTITSTYQYDRTAVKVAGGDVVVTPMTTEFKLKTDARVPKMGMMLVGLGGNNGTTVAAGIIANREGISWRTRRGVQNPNYYGSITQSSTMRMGFTSENEEVTVPLCEMVPMVHPNDMVLGGWDISKMNLADGMERSGVLEYDLQRQLVPYLKDIVPLPSVYHQDFIAANQKDRADNLITGTKSEQVAKIRQDIRDFKEQNGLDKVVVLWSATTERFARIEEGLNDTADNLLAAIERGEDEVSPSTMFAVACILERTSYINGSPQNTFVPGVVELAERTQTFIGGDDFKSGQTKMKSVLVDFLVSAGIKPVSIVSYNHLGNNDGRNLSAPQQFRSKEISKSNVVDDMVASNRILYKAGEHPDHVVVIKYVPTVKDSKRALDEYTSKIFMGGLNTISMHNTCEDSLLAAPLIIDLAILCELCERISIRPVSREATSTRFHSVLSLLSYLLKAPMVPAGTPVVNALFKQREAVVNIMRACVGLPPENYMMLPHRLPTEAPVAVGAGAGAGAVDVAASTKAEPATKPAAEADAEQDAKTAVTAA